MARTVTGQILYPDGTAWSGGIVKFQLVEGFETSTTVYPKKTHEETLDASGEFSIDLAVPDSGTAWYRITLPDYNVYDVYLEAGAATNLQTLITIASTAEDANDLQTMIDSNNVIKKTTITENTTLSTLYEYYGCIGTFTTTFPASTGSGDVFIIVNVGAGNITPVTTGGDTVNGTTPNVIPPMTIAYYIDAVAGNWDSNW